MSDKIVGIRGGELACPKCGNRDIRTRLESERFVYGEGQEAATLQVEVPVRSCTSCGFEYTDGAADAARELAIRRHLLLLSPAEILEIRWARARSRKEFAVVTRIGEASLARWENGQLLQSGALDQLLYLLLFPENYDRLIARARRWRPDEKPPKLVALQEIGDRLRLEASSFRLTVYSQQDVVRSIGT